MRGRGSKTLPESTKAMIHPLYVCCALYAIGVTVSAVAILGACFSAGRSDGYPVAIGRAPFGPSTRHPFKIGGLLK